MTNPVHELLTVLGDPHVKASIKQWFLPDNLHTLRPVLEDMALWGEVATYAHKAGIDPERLKHAILYVGSHTEFDPFVFIDAAAIIERDYPAPRWLVPGLIQDGLTILGGSPKSGKSYMAYGLALAVARPALWCEHWRVEAGPVTYVSLEDDEADTYQRLQELVPGLRLAPGRLRFVHGLEHVPSFNEGFLGWVQDILAMHQPRVLIIDPISYLYVLKRTGSQFEETKDMLNPLRWLGKKAGCAIVAVDHRRKQSRDDVSIFDTLHGSVAKIAVADSLLMLQREEEEITVSALVRKGKDQMLNIALVFDDQGQATLRWHAESKEGVHTSELRQKIVQCLSGAQEPLSVEEIILRCEFVNNKHMKDAVKLILWRAEKARELERTTRGRYLYVVREA